MIRGNIITVYSLLTGKCSATLSCKKIIRNWNKIRTSFRYKLIRMMMDSLVVLMSQRFAHRRIE